MLMLKIFYPGHENSLCTLEDDGYTKVNYVAGTTVNDTLDANTPKGVLGGMIAAMKGSYEVGACTGATEQPMGLFINDAAGNAYENLPALASGKAPFTQSQGSYEVNVYETRNAADTADLTYAVGDLLYPAASGLLTKESGFNSRIFGTNSDKNTKSNRFSKGWNFIYR